MVEGVEDEDTLVVLRELGCDLVQGFHLARPMPLPDILRLLQRSAREAVPA